MYDITIGNNYNVDSNCGKNETVLNFTIVRGNGDISKNMAVFTQL